MATNLSIERSSLNSSVYHVVSRQSISGRQVFSGVINKNYSASSPADMQAQFTVGVINPETKERGIVYTAGCKPVSAASAVGPAYVSAKDAEIEEEEEDDDEEEDGEYGDEYEEHQGLESLLALASKALEDAAVSSASSTPAALPSTGQWKEKGDEEGKVGGAVKEEDGDEESIRLGKRRKLPGDLVH